MAYTPASHRGVQYVLRMMRKFLARKLFADLRWELSKLFLRTDVNWVNLLTQSYYDFPRPSLG